MLNKSIEAPLAIYRGAPKPLVLRNRLVAGGYEAFANTLRFKTWVRGIPGFELTVGAGITLSAHAGVADAMAVILPSPAQSLTIPKGNFASYEVLEGATAQLVMHGVLTGEGPA